MFLEIKEQNILSPDFQASDSPGFEEESGVQLHLLED